jgi:hypothetical protein
VELNIVNPDPRYSKATLVEPTTLGYIHVAAEVRPRPLPLGALVPAGREKWELLGTVKQIARELERLEQVEKATVFDAVAIAPVTRFSPYLRERQHEIHVAEFDVVVMIEIESPEAAAEVQRSRPYEDLSAALNATARHTHAIAARNAKRIGDVDTTRPGLFLFNHFAAEDAGVMLELWDYLAGWYAAETGLRTSVALMPISGQPSDFTIVNWARWDVHPRRHFWHQLSKRSFWKYVTVNLDVNHAASMPIYYRLA